MPAYHIEVARRQHMRDSFLYKRMRMIEEIIDFEHAILPVESNKIRYVARLPLCPVVRYTCYEDEEYYTDGWGCGCQIRKQSERKLDLAE